jgi:hypothetical protein
MVNLATRFAAPFPGDRRSPGYFAALTSQTNTVVSSKALNRR